MARTTWLTTAPSTAATAKTACQGVSSALLACGLVQTSDTGQINWGTASFDPGLGLIGYEVFRFNDALQATRPLFLKVEYRMGSAQERFGFAFYVSSGTDGAGGQTGYGFTGVSGGTYTPTTGSLGTNIPSWAGSDGSGIAVSLTPGGGGSHYQRMLVLDRTRDADGTPNGNGFMFLHGNGSGLNGFYLYSYELSIGIVNTYLPLMFPYPFGGSYPSAEYSGSIAVMPIPLFTPRANFFKMLALTSFNDVASGAVISVDHFGSTVDMVGGFYGSFTNANSVAPLPTNTRSMFYYGA